MFSPTPQKYWQKVLTALGYLCPCILAEPSHKAGSQLHFTLTYIHRTQSVKVCCIMYCHI